MANQSTSESVTDPAQTAQKELRAETKSASDAPKIELRKNKQRLANLAAVKLRAAQRTNRRIQLINDDIAEQVANKEARSNK